MNAPVARRRSLLQFSLRTLFGVMLLVAVFFGGRESMRPALEAERAKAERERYAALVSQAEAQLSAALAKRAEAEAQRAVLLESAAAFYRTGAEKDADKRPDRQNDE